MISAQFTIHEIEDKIKVIQLLAKISENPAEKKEFKIQIVNLKSALNCMMYMQLTY